MPPICDQDDGCPGPTPTPTPICTQDDGCLGPTPTPIPGLSDQELLQSILLELQAQNIGIDALAGAVPSSNVYVISPTVGAGVPIYVSVVHEVSTGDIIVSLLLLLSLAWFFTRSIFNSTRGTSL